MIDGDRVVVVAGDHAGRTGIVDDFVAQLRAIASVTAGPTKQALLASIAVPIGCTRVQLDAEDGQPARNGMPARGGRGGCHAIIPTKWLADGGCEVG